MSVIDDPNHDSSLRIIDGRALINAITESEAQHSTELGEAFNINTKDILFDAGETGALLYYKHKQDLDLIIESVILGVSLPTGATVSELADITILKNPTTGTIIDDAVRIPVEENRDFSAGLTVEDSLIYKASDAGKTLTDGSDYIYGYAGTGRTVLPISTKLSNGNSVGVKIDPKISAGTNVRIYCALVVHLKRPT
jgi:hypothetical protein